MADNKDAAPTPPEAEMKGQDAASSAQAAELAPAKKLWSDEDFGEVDFSGLKVAEPVDDIVDTPERIKSEAIVEPATIKKVRLCVQVIRKVWVLSLVL